MVCRLLQTCDNGVSSLQHGPSSTFRLFQETALAPPPPPPPHLQACLAPGAGQVKVRLPFYDSVQTHMVSSSWTTHVSVCRTKQIVKAGLPYCCVYGIERCLDDMSWVSATQALCMHFGALLPMTSGSLNEPQVSGLKPQVQLDFGMLNVDW